MDTGKRAVLFSKFGRSKHSRNLLYNNVRIVNTTKPFKMAKMVNFM